MKEGPVFCAIDTPDLGKASMLAQQLRGHVHGLKIGLEFFMANGTAGYNKIAAGERSMFLDVKLHDIPNTVAGALSALLPLKPGFVTVHTSGGPAMMKAAAETAKKAGSTQPKLLGVTALTSLNASDLGAVGQDTNIGQQVMRLAKLAKECGLDGVICSPEEVKTLRAALGPEFILMVPGIRPASAAADDQKRVMTPREAMDAGASYLVIGRPITAAPDPVKAAQDIAAEILE